MAHLFDARDILEPDRKRSARLINPDDEKAEADFLATYLRRARRKFSAQYAGTHFQNLPAELLQAIATQVAVPCTLWPGGITLSPHLSKFRLLCRATSAAGKAAMITTSMHRRYLSPAKAVICAQKGGPSRDTIDDLLKIFQGTGLGAMIKKVQFLVVPQIMHPALEHILVETGCLRNHSPKLREIMAIARRIMLEAQQRSQERFFRMLGSDVGFNKLLRLVSCMPNVEEVSIAVHDFWRGIDCPDLIDALHNDTGPDKKIVHWKLVPQVFELMKRFEITKFMVDADPALFGIPALPGEGGRRRSTRLNSGVDEALLRMSSSTLTHIHLGMSRYDAMSLGTYSESIWDGFSGEEAFKQFLKCAINLKSLELRSNLEPGMYEHREDAQLDGDWFQAVLKDQSRPALRSIVLSNARARGDWLADFLLRHKHTLRDVSLDEIELDNPQNAVGLVNAMRNSLILNFCNVSWFRFGDGSNRGRDGYEDICRLYWDEEEENQPAYLRVLDEHVDFGVYIMRRETRGRYLDDDQSILDYRAYRDKIADLDRKPRTSSTS